MGAHKPRPPLVYEINHKAMAQMGGWAKPCPVGPSFMSAYVNLSLGLRLVVFAVRFFLAENNVWVTVVAVLFCFRARGF